MGSILKGTISVVNSIDVILKKPCGELKVEIKGKIHPPVPVWMAMNLSDR
jgi:hypothetical protein